MAATCKEVTNLIYMSVTYCFTWKKYSSIIEWEWLQNLLPHQSFSFHIISVMLCHEVNFC